MNDSRSRPLLHAALAVALTLGSAAAMVVEIAAGRLLAPYVGMSLYTWTAIISVVLAGLSVGHWLGGRWSHRAPAFRAGLAFLGAGATSLLALPALRWAAGWVLPLGWDPISTIGAVTLLAFFLPSLCAGVVSPLLTKMALDAAPSAQAGRVLGRMYALGAGGAILGTLAGGYVFIGWIGSSGTFLAMAALYGVLGLPFVLARRKTGAAVAAGLAVVAGLGALVPQAREAFASPCAMESDYYCLRVDDFSPYSGRPSRLLVIDHMAHGMNDAAAPGLLYSPYLHLVDEVAARRVPGPEMRAFFIGGGAFTLPRAWQARYPALDAVVAEIDPAVTALAERALWFSPGGGVRVEAADARVLLQSLPAANQFDVIFGDAFHDLTVPAHLVTREFHDAVAARLAPAGLYAVNVVESRTAPLFLASLVKTLEETFPHVEVWLEDAEAVAQGDRRVTYVVLAGRQPTVGASHLDSRDGLARTWYRVPVPEMAAAVTLTDDFAPVDRLMAHVILDAALEE